MNPSLLNICLFGLLVIPATKPQKGHVPLSKVGSMITRHPLRVLTTSSRAEIGEKYGPFDLAMIPIWRGASLSFLGKLGLRVRLIDFVVQDDLELTDSDSAQLTDDDCLATLHATPEDALQMQQDVQARHALGMHFATFAGSRAEAREPVVRLVDALKERGEGLDWKKEGGFGVINMGERLLVHRLSVG